MNRLGRSTLHVAIAACAVYGLSITAQADQIADEHANSTNFTVAAKAGGQQGYCRSYAKRAVDANKANQRHDCGFSGPRWQSSSDNHYNWCMNVPRRRAESESRARQRQLQSCRQGATRRGNPGYCRSYAKRAVNAQKANKRNNCGYSGPRWQSNFDNHYNWCMNVPRRRAESESRARQRQLQACK